jgi:hypothetical protein
VITERINHDAERDHGKRKISVTLAGVSWISFVTPGKCWDSILKEHVTAPFHILPSSSFTI